MNYWQPKNKLNENSVKSNEKVQPNPLWMFDGHKTLSYLISGSITASSVTNRGTCNFELDGTPFPDTNNYTYIALNRTATVAPTTPIESTITISGSGTSFMLMDEMFKLTPSTTFPTGHDCNANMKSGTYYDIDIDKYCYCNGVNYVQFDDSSTTCS